MKEYYIVIDSSQLGPYSVDELKEKGIISSTLVWTEDMDNWIEAKDIEELKDIIKKSPPPIPKIEDKPFEIEPEISKKKRNIITPATEVVVAKETKSIFKQFLYGIFIGVVSFPIFYYGIYRANKYDNFNIYEKVHFTDNTMSGININDFPSWCGIGLNYDVVRINIEERKKIYTEKSAYSAIITFLVTTGLLISFRYIFKGAKWVQETSKKEIRNNIT